MPSPVQITFQPVQPPSTDHHAYQPNTGGKTEILPKGWSMPGWDKGTTSKPLKNDIVVDHDQLLVMRDGTRLYADVYRPNFVGKKEGKKVPAILSYSSFGKKFSGLQALPLTTWKCGVLPSDLSGLEKFEGVDPGEWCTDDESPYAVVSVDSRGSGHSEGFIEIMGTQEAEDGYDTIEAIAKLPWCDGSVAMAGNSHLGIVQWFIAATQPPSLKAIAPLEACGDLFREQFVRGGVFNISNFQLITNKIMRGTNGLEDFPAMYSKYPLAGPYWNDKRADMAKIVCPAFIGGSDITSIHTMGSLRGFMELGSKDKFLRWSGYQEWFDLWAVHERTLELKRFFDRYVKGIENGFEHDTPRIRMTCLRYGDDEPVEDIPFSDYPAPSTYYKTFHLIPDGTLSPSPLEGAKVSTLSYDSVSADSRLSFTHSFSETTRILGFPKIYLSMSCNEQDDLCVYVQLRKLDSAGNLLFHIGIPVERRWKKRAADFGPEDSTSFIAHPGSLGVLRASHRAIDRSKSLHENYPFHPHDKVEKIEPGTVVDLEIGIWHMGAQFEKGESIRVDISGHNPNVPELQALARKMPESERNKGAHFVHFGGKYNNRIILPFVPL
ncbi:alpha/beta-hydrolase [Meredithblackwellia eburnea MCA 4105]